MMRLAVAGAGLIGRRHIQLIADHPRCACVGVADPAPAAAEFCAAQAIAHDTDLATLIDAVELDGVIIATPNALHVDHALACITRHLPCLIEKPVAADLDDGHRLLAAMDQHATPVLVGHHRRHSPIMETAVAAVRSGAIGAPVAVTGATLFHKGDHDGYFDGANAWRRAPGGGPILINLIHDIDNLRALCGEIVEVTALTSRATRDFEVEDTAALAIRFASGALGTFMLSDTAASATSWEHTSGEDAVNFGAAHAAGGTCYEIAGTRGSLSVPTLRVRSYPNGISASWRSAMVEHDLDRAPGDPLVRQLEHFCDVVAGAAAPLVSVRDGVENLRVIEAIGRSAATGQTVFLS
ncbi:MAG: Gfo/Idh/MocA family oxidoreductase [Pseudomonadota bacterium]